MQPSPCPSPFEIYPTEPHHLHSLPNWAKLLPHNSSQRAARSSSALSYQRKIFWASLRNKLSYNALSFFAQFRESFWKAQNIQGNSFLIWREEEWKVSFLSQGLAKHTKASEGVIRSVNGCESNLLFDRTLHSAMSFTVDTLYDVNIDDLSLAMNGFLSVFPGIEEEYSIKANLNYKD